MVAGWPKPKNYVPGFDVAGRVEAVDKNVKQFQLGAEVTGVCSTRNVDMVRAIGADRVIDYTQEDFTQSGQRYDLILDQVANHSLSDCRRALTPQGIHMPNSGHSGIGYAVKALLLSLFVRRQGRPYLSIPKKKN
jgi:NADPH:quinone reductase-like Zn-dependent oxidoreductase